MNWSDGAYKAMIRDHLLAGHGRAPSKVALFMPGWDLQTQTGCLCVERALALGTIDRNTAIFAVERHVNLIEGITTRLDTFKFAIPPVIIADELHHVPIGSLPPLDLVNLDFMGCLTHDVARWMADKLVHRLAPDATLGVTLTHRCRNNSFMNQMALAWRSQPQWRTLAGNFGSACGLAEHPDVLLHLLVLNSCFSQFKFISMQPKGYCDHIRHMVAFRFNAINRLRQPDWPTIDEVLGQFAPVAASPIPLDTPRLHARAVTLPVQKPHAPARHISQAIDTLLQAGLITDQKSRRLKMMITKTTQDWAPS